MDSRICDATAETGPGKAYVMSNSTWTVTLDGRNYEIEGFGTDAPRVFSRFPRRMSKPGPYWGDECRTYFDQDVRRPLRHGTVTTERVLQQVRVAAEQQARGRAERERCEAMRAARQLDACREAAQRLLALVNGYGLLVASPEAAEGVEYARRLVREAEQPNN